jgi:hypothetical protein
MGGWGRGEGNSYPKHSILLNEKEKEKGNI